MSEHTSEDERPEDQVPAGGEDPGQRPGRAADVGAVPGEKPKDDPDEEGEDRFDAG